MVGSVIALAMSGFDARCTTVVAPCIARGERIEVPDLALDDLEASIAGNGFEVPPAARREVVVDDDAARRRGARATSAPGGCR